MLRLSLFASKVIYTLIIVFCDCIFLLIPFLLHGRSQNNQHDIIGKVNSVLGGALLALAFTNLMENANSQMKLAMPDFPISYVFTVFGILLSCFFPKFFPSRKKKSNASGFVKLPTVDIEEMSDSIELEEMTNKNDVDTNDDEKDSADMYLFIAMCFFETFTSNIVIGVQNETRHLPMLTMLTIIGDSIQMIAVGLMVYKHKSFKNVDRRHSLYTFLPLLCLFVLVCVTNVGGIVFGMVFVFFLDSPANQWWVMLISECMLALNAGMFVKISIMDMIYVELEKHSNGSFKVFVRIALVMLGSTLGIFVTTFANEKDKG
jgi:nitrate reductase NapE component